MRVSVNSLENADAAQSPGTWAGSARVEHEDDLEC